MFDFKSSTLTFDKKSVITQVSRIIISSSSERVYFNNNESSKFTKTHPIFIKRDSEYSIVEASDVVQGDILLNITETFNGDSINESITETEVLSIHHHGVEEGSNVYTFTCDPYKWYFAGGTLVHNK